MDEKLCNSSGCSVDGMMQRAVGGFRKPALGYCSCPLFARGSSTASSGWAKTQRGHLAKRGSEMSATTCHFFTYLLGPRPLPVVLLLSQTKSKVCLDSIQNASLRCHFSDTGSKTKVNLTILLTFCYCWGVTHQNQPCVSLFVRNRWIWHCAEDQYSCFHDTHKIWICQSNHWIQSCHIDCLPASYSESGGISFSGSLRQGGSPVGINIWEEVAELVMMLLSSPQVHWTHHPDGWYVWRSDRMLDMLNIWMVN